MVRLKDIAEKAGVGIGTVSRMISGKGYVSQEMRDKIQAAMDELGYIEKKKEDPSQTEEKKNHNIRLVGVMVPFINHPFFSQMVQSLETELRSRGYRMVLFSEQCIPTRQQEAIDLLFSGELDGLIDFGNEPYDFPGRQGKALVAFDRNWSGGVPIVRTDHKIGGRMVAEEFIRQGRKKIVFFAGGQDFSRSANTRAKEAKRILEENGGEVIPIFLEWDAMSYQYNRQIIDRYRNLLMESDGCFTTDIGALCCQMELQRHGIRIPEEFMVISYDGTGLIDIGSPALPAIYQDSVELSRMCVDVMEKMIRGEEVELLYEVHPVWKNNENG